ncbi:hypothetical protein K431DRAFT_217510 [Polychaeton citri CBS 116435]|uniref:Uncharacterized protein n=1 Tax=Polychaeton citri CBS 116435 TaxID=1314669 RepID=A0A9P4URZ2_9PEZI|nr:hypothetical protein K431DRAFT_217510 [Polychaeton citri CBS 116435]
MAPSRFTPTPVETTTRSSKDRSPPSQDESQKPAKRFVPEIVQTEVKSSKDAKNRGPETGDIRALRKWHVQPEETSVKSSSSKEKAKEQEQDGKAKAKPRKFAVQPVEESTTSSKNKQKPVRKWAPQLVDTQQGSRRSRSMDDISPAPSRATSHKMPPRKFEPVLIDTAKRTRKTGDGKPSSAQEYRTEQGFLIHAREHRKHITGTETPVEHREVDISQVGDIGLLTPHANPCPSDMRRQLSPMDGSSPSRPSLERSRSHSYRCPSLDPIESSESEQESVASSLSCSPGQGSPITSDSNSFNDKLNEDKPYNHPTRIRESISEGFSHYLLELEAKRAERRMQEQALAAFANSDYHEPVMHYMNSEKDSEEEEEEDELEHRPTTWEGHDEDVIMQMTRRDSTVRMPYEQLEMQRHAERLEKQRSAEKSKQESQSPWWNPFAGAQFDSEMKSMQDRARPPMLGQDLRFPRCRSPDPARFDVTQSSAVLRSQMCYLSEAADAEKKRATEGGLWHAPVPQPQPVRKSSSKSNSKEDAAAKGLWGGFCAADDTPNPGLAPPTGPTGLMTPRVETSVNPFEHQQSRLPPTPPASLKNSDISRIDSVLIAEKEFEELMEREFPDSFITQVFNYLSLGYPSLAKPFDEELSKISGVSMSDLRSDDKKAKDSPRGYIRLGSDFEGGNAEEHLQADNCSRWQALKQYIREWVRQEQNNVEVEVAGGNWGTGARRGSWAI